MEIAERARTYIEKAVKVLPEDNRNHEYFAKFLTSFDNAKELANNDEKKAIIADASVKVANQLTFIMFREGLLSEELEKEYRDLPKPEETEAATEKAHAPRKERQEKALEANKALEDEQAEFDVFTQVLGGRSVEEAKQKLEDYKNAGGR